jgi:hypothetical protein
MLSINSMLSIEEITHLLSSEQYTIKIYYHNNNYYYFQLLYIYIVDIEIFYL